MKRILLIIAFPLAFTVFWISLFFMGKDKIDEVYKAIGTLVTK